jgi:hypothetical protein
MRKADFARPLFALDGGQPMSVKEVLDEAGFENWELSGSAAGVYRKHEPAA